jgi:hypothetical protein
MSTMNKLATALLLAFAGSPSHAHADDPPSVVNLQVGQQLRLVGGGSAPMCDNPSVATLSLDGAAVLTGVGVGSTTCALFTVGNVRYVFRVVVSAAGEHVGTDQK